MPLPLLILSLFELIVVVLVLAEFSKEMADNNDERHVENNDLTSHPVVFGGCIVLPAFLIHGLEVSELHETEDSYFEEANATHQATEANAVLAD